jgi:lipopolysaccharide export system protein LptA
MTKPILPLLLCSVLSAVSFSALAERADREKPINIEADKVTVDERNRTHTFDGNVVLTQGTLVMRGNKLVVVQGADGFQTGVATAAPGKLASFRQKREASQEFIDGEAERIEYDSRNETAKLFGRARIQAGQDILTGDVIEYDALTENYTAFRLPPKGSAKDDSRIRMTIQPKPAGKP